MAFSWLMMDTGEHNLLWEGLSLVWWSWVPQETRLSKTWTSKPVSCTPHSLCISTTPHGLCIISSCLPVPSLLEFLSRLPSVIHCNLRSEIKTFPFLSKLLLFMEFHHSNRKSNSDSAFTIKFILYVQRMVWLKCILSTYYVCILYCRIFT